MTAAVSAAPAAPTAATATVATITTVAAISAAAAARPAAKARLHRGKTAARLSVTVILTERISTELTVSNHSNNILFLLFR